MGESVHISTVAEKKLNKKKGVLNIQHSYVVFTVDNTEYSTIWPLQLRAESGRFGLVKAG